MGEEIGLPGLAQMMQTHPAVLIANGLLPVSWTQK